MTDLDGGRDEQTSYDAFVCHQRDKGTQLATRLTTKLRERGLSVWLDQLEIAPGNIFPKRIQQALEHSRCVLVLIGRDGPSEWQEMEITFAVQQHVPRIPVLLDGASRTLPLQLADRHYIALPSDLPGAALDALVEAIKGKTVSKRLDESPRKTGKKPLVGIAVCAVLALPLVLLLRKATPACPVESVAITSPTANSDVIRRPEMEGTVTVPGADCTCAEVWVVVHPTLTADYWVQPKATVNADGTWTARPYVADDRPFPANERFETTAFANPKATLQPSDVLHDWPIAAARSKTIIVTRPMPETPLEVIFHDPSGKPQSLSGRLRLERDGVTRDAKVTQEHRARIEVPRLWARERVQVSLREDEASCGASTTLSRNTIQPDFEHPIRIQVNTEERLWLSVRGDGGRLIDLTFSLAPFGPSIPECHRPEAAKPGCYVFDSACGEALRKAVQAGPVTLAVAYAGSERVFSLRSLADVGALRDMVASDLKPSRVAGGRCKRVCRGLSVDAALGLECTSNGRDCTAKITHPPTMRGDAERLALDLKLSCERRHLACVSEFLSRP